MFDFDDNAKHLAYPDPISRNRIQTLIEEFLIIPHIAQIDLEMVKMKLRDPEEGFGWSDEQANRGEIEYKRFLMLCKKYGKGIVPNKIMDNVWHYHILDTKAYHNDCMDVFGGYMHHYPYFGMRGEQDSAHLEYSFLRTCELYEREFGLSLLEQGAQNCWHDCQGRCWHACKSVDSGG